MHAEIESMFRELEGCLQYTELPRGLPPTSKDPHLEADEFIAATPRERVSIRRRYAQEREERFKKAVRAPRPIGKLQRPDKLTPKLRKHIRDLIRVGVSMREIARRLNVCRATVSRGLRDPMKRGRPKCK